MEGWREGGRQKGGHTLFTLSQPEVREVIPCGAPGPHPAHLSSGRAECQAIGAVLGRGWQGIRQLQTPPQHVAHQTTMALSRGTENLDKQGRFPRASAHLPAPGPGIRASPARARFPGYSSSASTRPGRGGPASERLRGSPTEGKAPERARRTERGAAEGSSLCPPPPGPRLAQSPGKRHVPGLGVH